MTSKTKALETSLVHLFSVFYHCLLPFFLSFFFFSLFFSSLYLFTPITIRGRHISGLD